MKVADEPPKNVNGNVGLTITRLKPVVVSARPSTL